MTSIVEAGSRPADYVPFITISQDPGGHIAEQRLQILRGGRSRLTEELSQNDQFTNHLFKIHDELSSSILTSDKLAEIKNELPDLTQKVLGQGVNEEALCLEEIVDIYFAYSQILAPAYLGFAKELKRFQKDTLDDHPTVLLFCGRDAFPFKLATQSLDRTLGDHVRTAYAPFNRLSYRGLFGSEDPQVKQQFLDDLNHFYEKDGLGGSHLIAVDFGFIGSLERINQMILKPENRPSSMQHFLFSTFHRSKAPWFIDSLVKMGFDTSADSSYAETNIHGYLNRLIERHPDDQKLWSIFMQEAHSLSEWSPFLNPYMLFLQELGAGLNESRQDSLNQGNDRAYKGSHLKFASLQQMSGLYAFLVGLPYHLAKLDHESLGDQEVLDSLKTGFDLFEKHSPFFLNFIPQEDRRHIEGITPSSAFGEVSVKLDKLRTLPISTVRFVEEER